LRTRVRHAHAPRTAGTTDARLLEDEGETETTDARLLEDEGETETTDAPA
jgi:hypothetical protein